MIYYLGDKVTNEVLDNKTLKRRNEAASWEYGYEPEHDLICISRNGTIGDIYRINGLNIALPAIPEETEILNHDKPKYDQKWKRHPLPAGLNAETQGLKEFLPYIEKEYQRRHEGVYVYINGQPVYIPGTQYFFLQWVKLDEGYPSFRIIQNELMIYWEACKADPRSYGICYVKNRRFGWSSECNAEILAAGTVTENSLCGIISKTREDAQSMFDRLVRSFKKLPSFFTPLWDGTSTPKKELNLTEPTTKRSTKAAVKKKDADEGLDTIIKFYSTVLNAMDGEKVLRSALDETGKFPKDVPFDKYWGIVKTSHRIGARIVGKSMVGSTMNSREKGGAEFKKIYDRSDPLKRNKNGQTSSGLYKLFIPARYCIEGFFDEFGFSIVEDPEKPIRNEFGDLKTIGAVTYLQNEAEALKNEDPEAYFEFLRQFPETEEHAFRDEAGDCAFDIQKIYEQLDYNENELEPGTIQRGNFQWKGGVQDTEVEWVPNPKGRFYLTWHGLEEHRNKWDWVTQHGIKAKKPRAGHIGSLAADPYNRSQTVDGRGSLGSIHGQTKVTMSTAPSEFFFLEYIDRPRTVELFFEDVIMAMVYFSMPILPELANEKFQTVLKDRGYRWFVLNRPGAKWKELSHTEKELGGVPPQGQKIGDAQFYAVEAFINDQVGVETRHIEDGERKFGEIGKKMLFNRTLTQWKDVDPEKRTKYDAYISSSLVLLANQRRIAKKETTKSTPRKVPFSRFDNTGSTSKRIA